MPRPATKAAFVIQHSDKPAADIIAVGRSEGIKLSKSYVAKVLSERPRPAPARTASSRNTHPQFAIFRKLVLRVGTARAREWLAKIDNPASFAI